MNCTPITGKKKPRRALTFTYTQHSQRLRFMGAGGKSVQPWVSWQSTAKLFLHSSFSILLSTGKVSKSSLFHKRKERKPPHQNGKPNNNYSLGHLYQPPPTPKYKETRVFWEHPWQNQHYRSRTKKWNHKFLHKIIKFLAMQTTGWNWGVRYLQIFMTLRCREHQYLASKVTSLKFIVFIHLISRYWAPATCKAGSPFNSYFKKWQFLLHRQNFRNFQICIIYIFQNNNPLLTAFQ